MINVTGMDVRKVAFTQLAPYMVGLLGCIIVLVVAIILAKYKAKHKVVTSSVLKKAIIWLIVGITMLFIPNI